MPEPAWKSQVPAVITKLRDHPPTEWEKPGFIGEVFTLVRVPLLMTVSYGAVRFLYESGYSMRFFPLAWNQIWEAVHE